MATNRTDPELIQDDDILPRRVPGEEAIAREALENAASPVQAGGERVESYNLSADAREWDPYGEGLEGAAPLEEEPRHADILPDQIQEMPGARDEENPEISARPREDLRPIVREELPEG